MMMYHPIKCSFKKISSSVDMAETVVLDYISPHYEPELEDSKPIFLHITLAHDNVSQYQVWLQKVQQLWRYCQDEQLLEFGILSVTLTLTRQSSS